MALGGCFSQHGVGVVDVDVNFLFDGKVFKGVEGAVFAGHVHMAHAFAGFG